MFNVERFMWPITEYLDIIYLYCNNSSITTKTKYYPKVIVERVVLVDIEVDRNIYSTEDCCTHAKATMRPKFKIIADVGEILVDDIIKVNEEEITLW